MKNLDPNEEAARQNSLEIRAARVYVDGHGGGRDGRDDRGREGDHRHDRGRGDDDGDVAPSINVKEEQPQKKKKPKRLLIF